VGLDLSINGTAACILTGEPGIEPTMDTRLLYREKTSGVRDRLLSLISVAEDIVKIIKEAHTDAVIIEAPAQNQVWQAAAIGEVHGIIKTYIWSQCGIIPMVEQATKARANVVGTINRSFKMVMDGKGKKKRQVSYGTVEGKSGRAKKATVKDIIESKLKERGLVFDTQDSMDAYVIARLGWMLFIAG
jgi:hypothetical protein